MNQKCLVFTLAAFILLSSLSESHVQASRFMPSQFWKQMLPKKLPAPSSSPSRGTNSVSGSFSSAMVEPNSGFPEAIPAATSDDCQRKCGDINIPFPFGTTRECSLNQDFLITCRESQPFFPNTNTSILDISVEGQIRASVSSAYDCYNNGKSTNQNVLNMNFTFPISYTRNKFTAIGCDTNALIAGLKTKPYVTGCISYCENVIVMVNGSCSGMGCCETSLPKAAITEFSIQIISFFSHELVEDFNPCSYAFVADANWYNFSSLDLALVPGDDSVGIPVVLDWAVGNESCSLAGNNKESFGCKAENSICYDSDNGPGYRCKCPDGFAGNPYIIDGCHDVNECEIPGLNQCSHKCENTIGSFSCNCPKGYHGDGRKVGTGCTLRARSPFFNTQTGLVIGGSASFGILFLSMGFVILGIHRRSILKLRKENFKQNGGFLLQKLFSKTKHSEAITAKLISEEELNKATNNFNKNMVIGQGGFGVVYKGTLSDTTTVAIKRAKAIDQAQVEQFVNEVIVLSQIYHPNVVKLMGCCLETSVPLLVYEFITNGTLFQHLHSPNWVESLPWATRLRIAEETAAALAYMHSMQIIHRDVKSANILLDDDFNAKVSDFGVSRLVPFDKKQICTLVQGTLGYMDPEYFQSGILTEKSDVYSFGVVLVELMTGKKAICSECEEKSLALYFISSMKRNKLDEILDERVREEGSKRDIEKVGEIAKMCLRLEGEMRPTMTHVVQELHILRQPKK